ncbi:unnamed protein product, partial [Mesorhabditis belari]|uniref:RING-type domain-containing protein n=1 Tax=Mesorhabditis belari TaxID=2138241 RepID=A0AAF3F6N9_9BILA
MNHGQKMNGTGQAPRRVRRNRANGAGRPWIRVPVGFATTEKDWEPDFNDAAGCYVVRYPELTPKIDPANVGKLTFIKWDLDDENIPPNERAWMSTQWKTTLDVIKSFEWKPRIYFNIDHIKLVRSKLRKQVSSFGQRDMTEEAFRTMISNAVPRMVYQEQDQMRYTEKMRERIAEAMEVFKAHLMSNPYIENLSEFFETITRLHSSHFIHFGPTMALRVLQEYENDLQENKPEQESKFQRWRFGEHEVTLWKMPFDETMDHAINEEMQRLNAQEIFTNLKEETFEMAVPNHNFKILVGEGGECDFLSPNDNGCSLLILGTQEDCSQMLLSKDIGERRSLTSFERRRILCALGEKDCVPFIVQYRNTNKACIGRQEIEKNGLLRCFACPKDFILGEYHGNTRHEESVSILFRWQKSPPLTTILLTIKEPALVRYANEVFSCNGFPTNIKRRYIDSKELEIRMYPDDIKNEDEACEWVRSILTPAGVEIESVKMNRYPPQELTNEVKLETCRALSGHFIKSAMERKVWIDGSENNPKDQLALYRYILDYSKHKMEVPSYLRPIFDGVLKKFNDNPFGENSQSDAQHWIRICDLQSTNLNTDKLGVCGWPKSYADRGFKFLRSLFNPKTFKLQDDADNWIFFDIGAAWLHEQLEQEKARLDFFYDVDVTRRTITMWGPPERTEEISETIRLAIVNRHSMKVKASIAITAPQYPNYFDQLVDYVDEFFAKDTPGFAYLLAAKEVPKITFDATTMSIVIDGTVAQYEQLRGLLDDLAQTAFKSRHFVMENRHFLSSNCGICLSPPLHQDYYRLEICGHYFCRECINKQVLTDQRSPRRQPLVCAYEECGEPFVASDIKRLLLGAGGGFTLEDRAWWLDAEKLEAFMSTTLERLLNRPGSSYFNCITPDCRGIFERKMQQGQLSNAVSTCDSCSRKMCSFCGLEEHSFMSCFDYKNLRNDDRVSVERYMTSLGPDKVALCPGYFCWICNYMGSNGDIYRHLQEVHKSVTDHPWVFNEEGHVIAAPPGEEQVALREMVALEMNNNLRLRNPQG